jgi:hypothetical protein
VSKNPHPLLLFVFLAAFGAGDALRAQQATSVNFNVESATAVRAPAPDVPTQVSLVVERGVPLRVALTERVPIRQAGDPVKAKVVEPVYSFDHLVIPVGTVVTGRVTEVKSVGRRRRAQAIMDGDFTPLREAKIEFDQLLLKDHSPLLLQTSVSPGEANVIHLGAGDAAKKKEKGSVTAKVRADVHAKEKEAMDTITAPHKGDRLKAFAVAQLPYHHQYLPAGMHFDAELQEPIDLGVETVAAQEFAELGSTMPQDVVVKARLVTALSSATAQRGTPVEAALTQPLFSPEHQLILPEGSRLLGTVVRAEPARYMARDGQLRFMFERVELPHLGFLTNHDSASAAPAAGFPASAGQNVEGSLDGVWVSKQSRVKLDSEGGAHVAPSKGKYIEPLVAVMLASTNLEGDRDAALDHGGMELDDARNQALSGGVGFRAIGALVGLTSRTAACGIGFYGAGWSVYSHLIARGHEVVFAKDTPMEIRFGRHESAKSAGSPAVAH